MEATDNVDKIVGNGYVGGVDNILDVESMT